MTRRGLFRTLVLAAAWAQTKHLTWAFPEPLHVIPTGIRITGETLRDAPPGAFVAAVRAEYARLVRELERDTELTILKNRMSR